MMSRFSTMNGVNHARAATVAPPPQRQGGMQGTVPNMQMQDPLNYQPSYGNALPGTTAAQPASAPPPPPSPGQMSADLRRTGGMMGTAANTIAQHDISFQGQTAGSGVNPGQRMGSGDLPPPPQQPGFDPNDPNNAALAGYLAAR